MFKYEVPTVPRLAVDGMDGGEGSGLVSELRVQIWVPKLLSRVTLIKCMPPPHATTPTK